MLIADTLSAQDMALPLSQCGEEVALLLGFTVGDWKMLDTCDLKPAWMMLSYFGEWKSPFRSKTPSFVFEALMV